MYKNTIFSIFFCGLAHVVCAQAGWQQTKGPEGGTVYDLIKSGGKVYACTGTGLWTSVDDGAHWAHANVLGAEEICASIFNEGNEMILVSFEVEGPYDYPASTYRSTDGGTTWAKSPFPYDVEWSLSWGAPKIWRDGSNIWFQSGTDDLLKSSDDGMTWTEIAYPAGIYPNSVAVSGDNLLLYSYFETFRSADAGLTWQSVNQDTIYTNDFWSDGDLLLKLTNDSLWRSDDFGYTWQGDSTDFYEIGNIFRTADGKFAMMSGYLYLSDDGIHWVKQTQTYVYADRGVDLGSSFLLGGQYGFYRTVQNNTAFETSNSGFVSTTVYGLAATPKGRLVAGARTGSFISLNGGNTWQPLLNTTGSQIILITLMAAGNDVWGVSSNDSLYVLRENSNVLEINTLSNGWYLGESFVRKIDNELFLVEDERMLRSLDNGQTWQPFLTASISDGLRDIAKIDGNYFFVSNGGIVSRSADDGLTWSMVQETWSPGAHRPHILPVVGNRLFHFEDDEAYFTDDLGGTWTPLPMNGLPVNSWGDIVFDFTTFTIFQNTFIVTLSGYGVYISFDQGNSWEPFNEGLFSKFGYAIAVHDNTLYYGGSRSGVWSMNSQFEVFSGTVFNDLNDNKVQDAGENGLENVLVEAQPLGSLTKTTAVGSYSLVAAAQLDSIKIGLPNKYSTSSPTAILAAQIGGGYDFAVHFIPNIVDLRVDLVNWQVFRPGFDNKLTMTVENVGTAASSNSVAVCKLPAGVLYQYAFDLSGNPAFLQNDSVIWQFGPLQPDEKIELQIYVVIDADVPLDSDLTIPASVTTDNDQDLTNNEFRLNEKVVGSYDPNDKKAVAQITPAEVAAGLPIEYVIRFENTGSFYAEKVVVTDQLEADLNPSTFRFISSSHDCEWHVKNGGIIEFTFSGIFLSPQETGFVKFSVEADRGLALNQAVSNTAEIVFDFNQPIITNTVTTTVMNPVSVKKPTTADFKIDISPNPAKDFTTFGMSKKVQKMAEILSIFDQNGRQVLFLQSPGLSNLLDVSGLASGKYDVRLIGKSGDILAAEKLLVLK